MSGLLYEFSNFALYPGLIASFKLKEFAGNSRDWEPKYRFAVVSIFDLL